jgi:hypothetical protein
MSTGERPHTLPSRNFKMEAPRRVGLDLFLRPSLSGASPGSLCEGRNGRQFDGDPSIWRIHAKAAREVQLFGLRDCIGHHIQRVSQELRPALHGNSRGLPGLLGTESSELIEGMRTVAVAHSFWPVAHRSLPFVMRLSGES